MRTALLTIAAALVLSHGAFAMEHGMLHGGEGSSPEMMHHMKTSEQVATESKVDKHEHGQDPAMDRINAHMEKMDFIMEEITGAKTPEQRRSLMAKHIGEMQGVMEAMRQMMWCCLPGGHHGGEHHAQHTTEIRHMSGDGGIDQQFSSVLDRLKIMQQLLEQIIHQQSLFLDELTASGGK